MSRREWRDWLGLPQWVLLALGVLLALAVFTAGITTAAPFAAYNADWTGTTDLRDATLADENTTLVVDTPAVQTPPPTPATTAFVVGVPTETDGVTATSSAVLANGGTVVITDEAPGPTNTLLATLGATARVTAGPVRDPQSYHRRPVLPLATTTNATDTIAATEVTLNHAGTVAPGSATVLATTSQFAYVDANRNERFDAGESLAARPVMTREPVGNGTVVVISDSSVFINAMYDREGNQALATWLTADSDRLVVTGASVRPLPRLATLLLWLKSTPAAQAVLLGVMSGSLLLVGRPRYRTAVLTRVSRGGDDSGVVGTDQVTDRGPDATESAYESGLMSRLRTAHPEWEPDTLRRLVTAVTARRRQSDSTGAHEDNTDE